MMKDMSSTVVVCVAAVLLSSAVTVTRTTAFVLPKSNGRVIIPYTGIEITRTALIAATLDQPPTSVLNKNGTTPGLIENESHDAMGGSWECNEDITDCKQVAECDEEKCKTSLDVRIHGDWYDLTGWRKAHPAGVHWIDWYDGRDATKVMDAFHSEKGRKMYKRLPKSKVETSTLLENNAPVDSKTQIAFRELRTQLEQDGWWKRNMIQEYKLLSIWGSLVTIAAVTARTKFH